MRVVHRRLKLMLIFAAYLMDLLVGDPAWLPHPVKGMGALIGFLDQRWRGESGKALERIKGAAMAVLVVAISGTAAYGLLVAGYNLDVYLGNIVWVVLGFIALSAKDLFDHARAVRSGLQGHDLAAARQKLSLMVGRDTAALSEEAVVKACLESVAESACDGIIAPLFYLFLGGPVLALMYKAASTLDSMVGHKDKKYLHFGWFSARLDDALNFIPAKICGGLLAVASLIHTPGSLASLRMMLRDGRKHPSPNSGIPEAAMAGALGVSLGGERSYQGERAQYPYIGDQVNSVIPEMIDTAIALSLAASVFMVAGGSLVAFFLSRGSSI